MTALRAKGETAPEVDALVGVMLRHARLLDFGPLGRPVALDVVGTGGDQAHTVNISTMSALVCVAAGVPVIKHGNEPPPMVPPEVKQALLTFGGGACVW